MSIPETTVSGEVMPFAVGNISLVGFRSVELWSISSNVSILF